MSVALDVSNVNPASLAEVRASGCRLLICKATEGDSFKDATLDAHRQIARTLGIRFGSYLFLHTASKSDEADFYLRYAKPSRGELVIVDSESGGQDGRPVSRLAARTDTCARELEARGHRPILYASSSAWLEMVAAVPDLRRLRVWEAQYPGRFGSWFPRLAAARTRLRHGASTVLWQFTDSYEVGGRRFDASRILVPVHKL